MLTNDEAELYDRQIRLWGVSAQSKIRQSKVLMLGFNGLASEVAKILVLAGIDTLTIVDDVPLQESDRSSNLFCRPQEGEQAPYRTHAVVSKLKTLNPLVKVNIDNSSILSKKPEEYKNYDLVTLHSFLSIDETCSINDICRSNTIKFYIVLDYGFFGFMFNDLGPEFKFSYEEFCEANQAKESGEAKDPISLLDDEAPVDDVDQGYSASDEEEDRPKKRRRLHSPPKQEVEVKTDNNEKQTKTSSLPYVTFRELIKMKNFAFNKQTSPILPLSIGMYKFYSQYKHLPQSENPQSKQEDLTKLNKIIDELRTSTKLHDAIFKKLDSDWSSYIYGSLSAVCAVLGGVAGQDMIRALSNKDIPINNTFAFDGISMNGIVEKTGIVDSKALIAQPVVRDLVQIDDDD